MRDPYLLHPEIRAAIRRRRERFEDYVLVPALVLLLAALFALGGAL